MNIREWATWRDNRLTCWDHNILIGDWTLEERLILFGFQDLPHFLPEDTFIEMPLSARWPEIMVKLGLFSSITQAKKNGWDKDIPNGWTEEKIFREKKSKIHFISIWKVPETGKTIRDATF